MADRFYELVCRGTNLSEDERCLVNAILRMSVTVHASMTFDQIYESLKRDHAPLTTSFMAHEKAVIKQLNRIEDKLTDMSTQVTRLQTDADAMKAQIAAMNTVIANAVQAQTDANARFAASIQQLLNNSGSGDAAALDAIASEMEATLADSQAATKTLQAAIVTEQGQDATPPPPPPPPTLTINPTSVSLPASGTQAFTANLTVKWVASKGTIDASGNYTAPVDPTVTADTVTATSTDGQSATATVTIQAAQSSGGTPVGTPSAVPTQGIKQ